MTREEFAKGWVFLTVQPWGKRYAGADGAAMVQSELYYKKFCNTNAYVWQGCCEILAEGDHWPNIDELRQAIKNNTPKSTTLYLPPQACAEDDYYPKQVVMAWKNHQGEKKLLAFAEALLQPFLDNPTYGTVDKEKAVNYVVKLRQQEGV
jgi:hypothetical protein